MIEFLIRRKHPETKAVIYFNRYPLQADREYTLGRKGDLQTDKDDRYVSGYHAKVHLDGGKLHIEKIAGAANKILLNGEIESDKFELLPGQIFIIGNTEFSFEESASELSGMTIAVEDLRRVESLDPSSHMVVIAELSGRVRFNKDRDAAQDAVLSAILKGITRAEVVALVRCSKNRPGEVQVDSARWRSGGNAELVPHAHVINTAIVTEKKPHFLDPFLMGTSGESFGSGFDWAMCAPLPAAPEPMCGIYVAGRLRHGDYLVEKKTDLEKIHLSDLKFVQIVADIFGTMKVMTELKRFTEEIREFLPKPILGSLQRGDAKTRLAPRVVPTTFFFCDLRNCCRMFDECEEDESLLSRWSDINNFLGIFSRNLIHQQAIIEDLEGDAVKGFWGWPDESSLQDQVARAIHAAHAILKDFKGYQPRAESGITKVGFGIGIAAGNAVVGRLGTSDQFKISVSGQVPNLAQRLQELTKPSYFGEPVLVDGCVHEWCCETARAKGREPMTHHLATIHPRGMRAEVKVCRVLPEYMEDSEFNLIDQYDVGRVAFEEGRWIKAIELLEVLSDFRPAHYLLEYIRAHHSTPPRDWKGVIRF